MKRQKTEKKRETATNNNDNDNKTTRRKKRKEEAERIKTKWNERKKEKHAASEHDIPQIKSARMSKSTTYGHYKMWKEKKVMWCEVFSREKKRSSNNNTQQHGR